MVLFKYKPDLAHLSAHLVDSTNVNFGKFHFLINKMKIFYLLNFLHTLYTMLLNNIVVCLLVILRLSCFIEVYGHFLVSSKCTEALNEILRLYRNGSSGFKHVPKRWLSLLLAIGKKKLEYWLTVKFLFSKCGIRRMSYNLEILQGWVWRKGLQ